MQLRPIPSPGSIPSTAFRTSRASAALRGATFAAHLLLGAVITTATFVDVPVVSAQSASARSRVRQLNDQGMAAYADMDFDRAEALLEQALGVALRERVGGTDRARVHLSLGVVAITGFSNTQKGVDEFAAALEDDPSIELDPMTSSPEVQSAFASARARVAGTPATTTTTTAATTTSTETDTAEVAAPTAEETADSSDEGRPGRVKFHALGASFHSTSFATQAEYGYSLLGPSVNYTYYVGRTWGFLIHGGIYFPLSGRMAGGETDVRRSLVDPYDVRRIGLNGSLMAATRREFGERFSMIAGAGIHIQSFKLVGTQYIALDGITGGIGLYGRLDYRVSDLVSIGLDVSAGIDPLDLIRHANRATITAAISSGFSVGLTFD